MTPREAFLCAIIANPEDDAPRLMYSDWLTEHGDPRGEFIRVQCQLAQMEEDDPNRGALEDREADLLWEHEATWLKALPKARGVEWTGFERGFPSRVFFSSVKQFLAHGAALAAVPVGWVQIEMTGDSMRGVLASPLLRHVRGLDLS